MKIKPTNKLFRFLLSNYGVFPSKQDPTKYYLVLTKEEFDTLSSILNKKPIYKINSVYYHVLLEKEFGYQNGSSFFSHTLTINLL